MKQEQDKPITRKQQRKETRARILKALEVVVAEKGAGGFTVQDICDAAGVGIGTFYHYFSTKEELLLVHHSDFGAYFKNTVVPLLEAQTVAEGLRLICHNYALYGETKVGLEAGAEILRARLEHNRLANKGSEEYIQRTMEGLFRRGQEEGSIRTERTPEDLARTLWASLRGFTYEWVMQKGAFSFTASVDYMVGVVLDAVTT